MTEQLLPDREPETRTNERGNLIKSWSCLGMDRYHWDFGPCTPGKGWQQYHTDQDAWYFGVWVHDETRRALTYAEGDLSLVECSTREGFQAELANMAEFYGAPPPAFVAIDTDSGQVTKHYDERPTGGAA